MCCVNGRAHTDTRLQNRLRYRSGNDDRGGDFLSGTAVAEIGSSAVIAFVIAAVIAGVTAATYSEFASIYSENGGILVIGASRDRRFRRWVFGSTPDRVVERAREEGVPVLVCASSLDVPERIEDYLSPVYRYLRKLVGRTGATATPEKKSSIENEGRRRNHSVKV